MSLSAALNLAEGRKSFIEGIAYGGTFCWGTKLRLLHLGCAGDELIGSAAQEGRLGFSLLLLLAGSSVQMDGVGDVGL